MLSGGQDCILDIHVQMTNALGHYLIVLVLHVIVLCENNKMVTRPPNQLFFIPFNVTKESYKVSLYCETRDWDMKTKVKGKEEGNSSCSQTFLYFFVLLLSIFREFGV